MAKDNIKVEWEGFKEQEQFLGGLYKQWQHIAKEELTKFGALVEEGAKALVHHDQGDLEDSISFDKAKQVGMDIVVEGGASSEYALIRHEAPYKKGTRDKYDNGAKFPNYYVNSRGKRTRSKPAWRGFQPGRKYLQNAVVATEKDYDKMNERIIVRVLRKR